MNSFDKQLNLLREFMNEGFIITDWVLTKEALKLAKNLQAANYSIRYSITKPETEEWYIETDEAIRIGTFGGKWGGKSSDSNVNDTFRQKRRSATTQGYDRMHGHYHNIEHGPNSNEIIKNWGGAARAFAPVQARYGYGKQIMKNIWTQYIVPKENMDWQTQILRLEISELSGIFRHSQKFGGKAPLTDLKYASIPQREIQDMLSRHMVTNSGRRTKIMTNEDYAKGETENNSAFAHNLETLGFLSNEL